MTLQKMKSFEKGRVFQRSLSIFFGNVSALAEFFKTVSRSGWVVFVVVFHKRSVFMEVQINTEADYSAVSILPRLTLKNPQ